MRFFRGGSGAFSMKWILGIGTGVAREGEGERQTAGKKSRVRSDLPGRIVGRQRHWSNRRVYVDFGGVVAAQCQPQEAVRQPARRN